MPTPSVRRRTRRAASKTQFGEATLGGFLHGRKPPGIFIALELILVRSSDRYPD